MKKTLWITWLTIFFGSMLLMLVRDKMYSQGEPLSEYAFFQMVDSNLIARATINYNSQSLPLTEIIGQYYRADKEGKPVTDGPAIPFRTKARLTENMEERLLSLPQFEPHQPNTVLLSVFWSVLPVVVIAVLIWFVFMRQLRHARQNTPTAQGRMDRILDKWEEQAKRMDAILDKMERRNGSRE
jgi:ATP-dependent Zn protease